MELILLGHIVGDFYMQTDKIANEKKESAFYMLLHCMLYMVGMYIVLVVITGNFVQALKIVPIIGLSHICIDIIKVKVDSKIPKYEYTVFLLDQAIHIIFLIFICYLFKMPAIVNGYSSFKLAGNVSLHQVVVIMIAGLICSKPAAIFVSLVFKVIPKTIENADHQQQEEDREQEEVIKIGSWIGILEREIILILGLLGQYGAIGFVLTAKSLARYKQLENKAFAEKYLVGTLLSALIAIACVAICSQVI